MGSTSTYELRFPALQVRQGNEQRIYTFAVDGKELPKFTTVSRVRRDERQIAGYQRPEVLAHVAAIRSYIETTSPMIPNAIVVAFDTRVRFEPADPVTSADSYVSLGTLVVPVDEALPDEDKPGWIVDGQQRCAAVREAKVDSFPLCVTAFITPRTRASSAPSSYSSTRRNRFLRPSSMNCSPQLRACSPPH